MLLAIYLASSVTFHGAAVLLLKFFLEILVTVKNVWCVARHVKNWYKKELKKLTLAKNSYGRFGHYCCLSQQR